MLAANEGLLLTDSSLEQNEHLFITNIPQNAVNVKLEKTKKHRSGFRVRGLQLPKSVQTIIDAKNSVSQNRVPTEVGYGRQDTLFNNSISKKSANVNP